jgi:DNA-binding response OmpR family regulator
VYRLILKLELLALTHSSDALNKNNIVSVVDDETETAHLLIEALHTIRGINVFKFTDPSMALEHFKTNKEDYALMISNLRLPVINGVQLLNSENSSNNRIRN